LLPILKDSKNSEKVSAGHHMLNIIELGLYSCRKRYISLQSFDCFVDVLFSFGVFDALVSLIELGLYSCRKRYISLQSFDCFVDVLFSFGVFDALVSLIELDLKPV
jgi:uncharacterized membrane protein